jgi:plastocyanin
MSELFIARKKLIILHAITEFCFIISIFGLFSPTSTEGQQTQSTQSVNKVSIVFGASLPNNTLFYDPQSISINTGNSINWTNNDNTLHTVTFVIPGILDSGLIPPGNSTSNTFFKQGIFNYFCKIHPFMTGLVTVS